MGLAPSLHFLELQASRGHSSLGTARTDSLHQARGENRTHRATTVRRLVGTSLGAPIAAPSSDLPVCFALPSSSTPQ